MIRMFAVVLPVFANPNEDPVQVGGRGLCLVVALVVPLSQCNLMPGRKPEQLSAVLDR